jgi:hypothetical protein
MLKAETTINDAGLAGHILGFVRSQIDGQRRNLFGASETGHGLTGNEFGSGLFRVSSGGYSLLKRRGLYRSRTYRIASNSIANEIDRDRFR